MPFVIDGYNLYHAMRSLDRAWSYLSRVEAVRCIETFVAARRQLALVVFDGAWPRERCPEEAIGGAVRVHFAGGGCDADSVIEDVIAHHSAPKQLQVVSSDRRIRQAARRRKAPSMGSEEFSDLVYRHCHEPRQAVSQTEPPEKYHGLSDPQAVAEWMTRLGLEGYELPPDPMMFPWR